MPLWTILVKWPAPAGPTRPQPRSFAGANVSKIGRSRSTAASSPPIIRL